MRCRPESPKTKRCPVGSQSGTHPPGRRRNARAACLSPGPTRPPTASRAGSPQSASASPSSRRYSSSLRAAPRAAGLMPAGTPLRASQGDADTVCPFPVSTRPRAPGGECRIRRSADAGVVVSTRPPALPEGNAPHNLPCILISTGGQVGRRCCNTSLPNQGLATPPLSWPLGKATSKWHRNRYLSKKLCRDTGVCHAIEIWQGGKPHPFHPSPPGAQ